MRESFLDLLRFVAALFVVFYHFGFRGYTADNLQYLSFPELSPFARYGYIGVDLFFMISGYVIPMSIKGRGIREFAVLRAIRLYPTFWLCMLITAAVMVITGAGITYRDILANMTMVAPVFRVNYIDGVYWSLFIELQFYALVGGILFFAGEDKLPKWMFVWLTLGAAVGILSKYTGHIPYLGGRYYMLFCVGAGCYFYHRQKSLTSILLIAGGLVMTVFYSANEARLVSDHYSVSVSSFIAVLISLLCAVLIFVSPRIKINAKVAAIGGLTYPLYLLHQNIGYAILNSLPEERRWEALGLVIVLVFAASYMVYKYFDMPARAWLRSFFQKKNTLIPSNSPLTPGQVPLTESPEPRDG